MTFLGGVTLNEQLHNPGHVDSISLACGRMKILGGVALTEQPPNPGVRRDDGFG